MVAPHVREWRLREARRRRPPQAPPAPKPKTNWLAWYFAIMAFTMLMGVPARLAMIEGDVSVVRSRIPYQFGYEWRELLRDVEELGR